MPEVESRTGPFIISNRDTDSTPMPLAFVSAAHAIERAALRSKLAESELTDDPRTAARVRHYRRLLAIEAKRLTRIVDALPEDQRPLGWDSEPGCEPEPTLDELSRVNAKRARRWHNYFPTDRDGWGIADWVNAMEGEGGEVVEAVLVLAASIAASAGSAGGLVKKIRRFDTNLQQNANSPSREELVLKVLKEIGDTVIYADLLAQVLGQSVGYAVSLAFNEVSIREGFPERFGSEGLPNATDKA